MSPRSTLKIASGGEPDQHDTATTASGVAGAEMLADPVAGVHLDVSALDAVSPRLSEIVTSGQAVADNISVIAAIRAPYDERKAGESLLDQGSKVTVRPGSWPSRNARRSPSRCS